MEERELMPNRAIYDLLGLRVSVWSNPTGSSECEDVGVLEDYDFPWVRIRKGAAEVLCFSIYNVRLVKALEPVKTQDVPPGESLLRPVDST